MRESLHRIRAVEEFWWHLNVLKPGATDSHTRAFAESAVVELEKALKRTQDAARGKGSLEDMKSMLDIEILIGGQQARIAELEDLLAAAYETYADDGFLVTKEEWLAALLLFVKEQEKA